MKTSTQANSWLVLSLLVLASGISIMSTDLYTPSLPHLPEFFGTTPQAVKLTITLNALAFGLAQLFLGPISDRYGRRPVMLVGLALFAGFSAACALAQSIGQLVAFRVLQGISASVEAVVGLAIVRDLFHGTDQVRALAVWGMAIAVAPAVAPIIGGYVHVSWGWQTNFWILATCGAAISLLVWRLLPESSTQDPHALRPRVLARNYAALVTSRPFMSYVLMLGASLGAIFAFITAGPFILIEQFGVRTHHYGYYQAAIVAAFFLGSLVSNALASRVRLERLLEYGLALSALGAVTVPLLFLSGHLTPVSLTLAMSIFAAGMGPIFAVAPSFALQHAAHRIGAGSALIGAGEMIMSGLASGLVTVMHDGTAKPLVVTLSILLAIGAAAWFVGRTRHGQT